MFYSNNERPFFRRRIVRGSSSFRPYNSRYRNNRGNVGRFGSSSFSRRQHSRNIAHRKNRTDASGQVVLCSYCNSWLHLYADCLERREHKHISSRTVHFPSSDNHASDNHAGNEPQVEEFANQNNTPLELSSTFDTLDLTPHSGQSPNHPDTFRYMPDLMTLALNMDTEFSKSQNGFFENAQAPAPLPDPDR